mgnify:CR=1 FL=1
MRDLEDRTAGRSVIRFDTRAGDPALAEFLDDPALLMQAVRSTTGQSNSQLSHD